MNIHFVDVQAQYKELKSKIDESVLQILESGQYILGKYNELLESSLADLHQVKYAIGVNSGTDALRIILDANGIGQGDEVITTSFTFVATIETIIQAGAKPVFVDIDPDTFNLDPYKVKEALSSKTKAILPVHLFGQMADMDTLNSIAEHNNLLIIEDAAQAIRSTYKNKFVGNLSRAAALSFYVTKNLGCAGDGGMILTNDSEVARLCRSLRVHGMGQKRYHYEAIGYTSRLSEIQAAILYHKLSKLEEWHERKNKIRETYDNLLNSETIKLPFVKPEVQHTWHQYTVCIENRDEVQQLLKEKGIPTMVYYPIPLHLHAPYEKYISQNVELPFTEDAAKKVLSLPIHPHLTDQEVYFIAKELNKIIKKISEKGNKIIMV